MKKQPISVEHIVLDHNRALVVHIEFPDGHCQRKMYCLEDGRQMLDIGGNIVDHVRRECPKCRYTLMTPGIHVETVKLTA